MSRPRRSSALRVLAAALAGVLAACAPSLDWRESAPLGSGAMMRFPCRPVAEERVVQLGNARLAMHMASCTAGGALFSLAFADAPTAADVAPLLSAWRQSAAANIAGTPIGEPASAVAGTTPNPLSGRLRIDGRLPDGHAVVENTQFFVRGLRLYQASVIGDPAKRSSEVLETFFGAVRLS